MSDLTTAKTLLSTAPISKGNASYFSLYPKVIPGGFVSLFGFWFGGIGSIGDVSQVSSVYIPTFRRRRR